MKKEIRKNRYDKGAIDGTNPISARLTIRLRETEKKDLFNILHMKDESSQDLIRNYLLSYIDRNKEILHEPLKKKQTKNEDNKPLETPKFLSKK